VTYFSYYFWAKTYRMPEMEKCVENLKIARFEALGTKK